MAGYSVIIIEKPVVAQTTATAGFPERYDTALQLKIIDELRQQPFFTYVIDGTKKGADGLGITLPADARRLVLSSTIIGFDRGSRNTRIAIGLGFGSAKVKVKFVFRDADNDLDELIILTQEGRFGNFTEVFDPDKNVTVTGASSEVVDGLVRVIKKNR
ncbi:MAG: DUF4410 domain-containing protein [Acidobacteria bacterium]|nr:DUF4410 domain-containing protein [Acidobacteriota bacterium]